MNGQNLRALVVDDEAVVRRLTARALSQEGFVCDMAGDGCSAEEMLRNAHYDVLVTDLKMPHRHGHALAVSVLQRPDRPLIVVLTGILEPRLAKDLVARGVDEIAFKPVDYQLFAAKVKALAVRRSGAVSPHGTPGAVEKEVISKPAATLPEQVLLSDIDSKLPHVSSILPISQAAIDVFNMTSSNEHNAQQIAAAIERDASLSAEVLRLTNSAFYNPSGQKIVEIDEAVARLGQKRVGELALATNALAALTAGMIPWMDVGLSWKRSIAAGVAVELLVEQGGHQQLQGGLLASAIMHSLGRVVLGTLYTRQFENMIQLCAEKGHGLIELERKVFPESHTEVMARLLATWNVPPDICEPLKYVAEPFSDLNSLPEPTRTKVELIKLSILIGHLAVGSWESWDWVEFPRGEATDRLRISAIGSIIEQTRSDLEEIANFRTQQKGSKEAAWRTPPKPQPCQLAYGCESPDEFDYLAALLPAMGIKPAVGSANMAINDENVLLNCVGTPAQEIAVRLSGKEEGQVLLLSEPEQGSELEPYGRVLTLPISYGALENACRGIATELPVREAKARDAAPRRSVAAAGRRR